MREVEAGIPVVVLVARDFKPSLLLSTKDARSFGDES